MLLTKTQAAIAAKLDEVQAELSISQLTSYKSEHNIGIGDAAVRKALKDMEKAGLVSYLKAGRTTFYIRTEVELPESAEQKKAREAAEKQAAQLASGEVGICQCCLREINLKNGKMVRHGWNLVSYHGGREGYHNGHCPGYGHLPISEDRSLAAEEVGHLIKALEDAAKMLAHYQARPQSITYFVEKYGRPGAGSTLEKHTAERNDKYMGRTRGLYVEAATYERELGKLVRKTEVNIANIREAIKAFSAEIEKHEPNHPALAAAELVMS